MQNSFHVATLSELGAAEIFPKGCPRMAEACPVGSEVLGVSAEEFSMSVNVTTCRLAKSPYATLYTGGSGGFVASTAAPIATGWSDPVPGRAFHPAVVQRLFTAHCKRLFATNLISLCLTDG